MLTPFLVLFAMLMEGCPLDPGCDPDEEDYSVDRVLTQGDLDEYGEDCVDLCRWAYMEQTGWHAADVADCVLDVTPQPGADPATEVGSVTYEVHGIEFYCRWSVVRSEGPRTNTCPVFSARASGTRLYGGIRQPRFGPIPVRSGAGTSAYGRAAPPRSRRLRSIGDGHHQPALQPAPRGRAAGPGRGRRRFTATTRRTPWRRHTRWSCCWTAATRPRSRWGRRSGARIGRCAGTRRGTPTGVCRRWRGRWAGRPVGDASRGRGYARSGV